MSSYPPHVIILIGPTASGKTELAIEIAEYFKTRIHNIDSRQIYKSMDIGTAKPSKNQQKKIKHFLIDIKEPNHPINVKQFQEIAQKSINREIRQDNIPFLVGGSGLYMNSITKGFFVPNGPPQRNLRKQLEELGQKECWEILKNCDPISTKNISYIIKVIKFSIDFEPLSYCGGKFNEIPFKNKIFKSLIIFFILNEGGQKI